jgi:hypothetical protein
MRQRIRLYLVVAVTTVVVATATWAFAQAGQQTNTPTILSGQDVGFRVDQQGTRDSGRITGSWVVRFNGQWVEPASTTRALPLTAR